MASDGLVRDDLQRGRARRAGGQGVPARGHRGGVVGVNEQADPVAARPAGLQRGARDLDHHLGRQRDRAAHDLLGHLDRERDRRRRGRFPQARGLRARVREQRRHLGGGLRAPLVAPPPPCLVHHGAGLRADRIDLGARGAGQRGRLGAGIQDRPRHHPSRSADNPSHG